MPHFFQIATKNMKEKIAVRLDIEIVIFVLSLEAHVLHQRAVTNIIWFGLGES